MSDPRTAPCTQCDGTYHRGDTPHQFDDDVWLCDECGDTTTDYMVESFAREREADNRAWQRELAMEAGMLHGIDAYNEAMGCEVDYDY